MITGPPIEARRVDRRSNVDFRDPGPLSPQREFSYRHCNLDHQQKNNYPHQRRGRPRG